MALLDSTWPSGGGFSSVYVPEDKREFHWDVEDFVKKSCIERNDAEATDVKLKSVDSFFGGATWNIFISTDQEKFYSQLGINFRDLRDLDTGMDFCCDIQLRIRCSKHNFNCKLKCDKSASQWVAENFLSKPELNFFLKFGGVIVCTLSRKKSSIKQLCSQGENTLSAGDSGIAPTHTQVLEKKDEDDEEEDSMVKVCQDLNKLLTSEEGSDVTIQVKDKKFKAHRAVLMARSSVFASMFRHDMKENATGVVDIEDCDPVSFPVLLEFIYSGTTEKLSVGNVFSLYTSADKYHLQDLKRKCLKFIKKNISVDTFCETLTLSLHHSETNLLQFTIDFFAKNFKEIILTVQWQDFLLENPIQGNEIFIKALSSGERKQ